MQFHAIFENKRFRVCVQRSATTILNLGIYQLNRLSYSPICDE